MKWSFEERELVYTYVEIAKVLERSVTQVTKLRRKYADFPQPPTSKSAIRNWKRYHNIGVIGRPPDIARQLRAYTLRKDGFTYDYIAKVLGLSSKRRAFEFVKRAKRRYESSGKAVEEKPFDIPRFK